MMIPIWVLALHAIDVIRNCWIKIKIFSSAQVEDLQSGVRQHNRAASDEKVGLPYEIVEELLEMFKSLCRKMAESNEPPIGMASEYELVA